MLAWSSAHSAGYDQQLRDVYREYQRVARTAGSYGVPLPYDRLASAGEIERNLLAIQMKVDKLPLGTMTPDEQLDAMLLDNMIKESLTAHRSALRAAETARKLPFEDAVRLLATRDFLSASAAIHAEARKPISATDYRENKMLIARTREARRRLLRARDNSKLSNVLVDASYERTASALDAYAKALDTNGKDLPGADTPWAIGEEEFRFRLRFNDMIDKSPDELIAMAQDRLAQTKQEMADAAKQVDPNKTLDEVWAAILSDHVTEGKQIIPLAEKNIADAIALIKDKGFVTIPDYINMVKVVEVGAGSSQYYPYGAYSGRGMRGGKYDGNYVVNPGYPWMDKATLDKHLQGNNNVWTRVVTLHETYPGHHLQGGYASAIRNPIRSASYSNTMVEGWGLYTEDLMYRHGYYPDMRYRLAQLRMRLWRCARVIIDCSLQCKGMTQEQAVDLLVKEVGLEKVNAEMEVRRYVTAPTQPLSYLVGWIALEEAIDTCKTKLGPSFNEREFHDSLLSLGSLPIKMIKWRMSQSPLPVALYQVPTTAP